MSSKLDVAVNLFYQSVRVKAKEQNNKITKNQLSYRATQYDCWTWLTRNYKQVIQCLKDVCNIDVVDKLESTTTKD